MLNEIDMRRLRFVVTPIRNNPAEVSQELEKAYKCWKEVWGYAFQKELNVSDPLYSDNFTRQSYLAMILHGEEPFGLCTLNAFNLHHQKDLDDSYFKVWPQSVIGDMRRDMSNIVSCCNASIAFNYRKNQLGISGIDLLFSMIILFMKSTYDIEGIAGTARIEKKVPEACERTGATFFARNVPFSIPGRFIDLVCWKRDLDLNLWDPHMRKAAEYIWKKSTTIYIPQQGERYAA
jgi:hypothetical protein